jgi:hypothetical protein
MSKKLIVTYALLHGLWRLVFPTKVLLVATPGDDDKSRRDQASAAYYCFTHPAVGFKAKMISPYALELKLRDRGELWTFIHWGRRCGMPVFYQGERIIGRPCDAIGHLDKVSKAAIGSKPGSLVPREEL